MKLHQRLIALMLLCSAIFFAACDDKKEGDDTNDLMLILLGMGRMTAYTIDGVSFNMAPVAGAVNFPIGVNDENTASVAADFLLGETEVTYELWQKVYTWATDQMVDHDGDGLTFNTDGDNDYYVFANTGRQGGDNATGPVGTNQHPVTTINWRSAMAWCNALTEMYNATNGTASDLACVYHTNSGFTIPIRQVNDTGTVTYPNPGGQDDPYVNTAAKGFRLPTINEWELAARYINGTTWLYGDHVSGDESGACVNDGSILGGQSLSTVFGDYAVHTGNSGSQTAAVKSKKTNALGLYGMGGNVWEWCFDWYPATDYRLARSGSWYDSSQRLQVGDVGPAEPYFDTVSIIGLRVAKSK